MKRLMLVILGLAFFSGCSKLSGDFQKSGRSAFIMLQQAEDGAPVLQTDLSRAFIEMKYAAKTDNDKRSGDSNFLSEPVHFSRRHPSQQTSPVRLQNSSRTDLH